MFTSVKHYFKVRNHFIHLVFVNLLIFLNEIKVSNFVTCQPGKGVKGRRVDSLGEGCVSYSIDLYSSGPS
jgi:hypothetical protein